MNNFPATRRGKCAMLPGMNLTRQQQWLLLTVLFLLVTGWAVKTYRAATPPPSPAETQH